MYDAVWRDEKVSSKTYAVIGPQALRNLTPDRRLSLYVLNTANKHNNSPAAEKTGHWICIALVGSHGADVKKKYDCSMSRRRRRPWTFRLDCTDLVWWEIDIFDSLGVCKYCKEIENFIAKFVHVQRYNVFINYNYCGNYVLMYLFYRSRAFDHTTALAKIATIGDIVSECNASYSRPQTAVKDHCLAAL